jgi:hypothetical protein
MKRSIDWLSLVAGVFFMVLSLLFFADQDGRINLDISVVAPLLIIALGVGSVCNGLKGKSHDD